MDNDERAPETAEAGPAATPSAGFLEFKRMAAEFREVTRQIYKIGRNIEEQHVRIREQLLRLRRNDIDRMLEAAGTDHNWRGHLCQIYALGDSWSLEREPPPWPEAPPPSRIPLRVSPAAARAQHARRRPGCPNGLAPDQCLCQKPK